MSLNGLGDSSGANISSGPDVGDVNSVVAGDRIAVDNTDPANPVVSVPVTAVGGSGLGNVVFETLAGALEKTDTGSPGDILTLGATAPQWVAPSDVDYVDPLTTDGDLVLRSGGITTRLPKGADGQVLTVDPGTHLPAWEAASGGGVGTHYADVHLTVGGVVLAGVTRVPFNVVDDDPGAGWSAGTFQWASPITGKVRVSCGIAAVGAAFGYVMNVLVLNDTTFVGRYLTPAVAGSGGADILGGGSCVLDVTAGDLLSVNTEANSGAPTIDGGSNHGAFITWARFEAVP